MMNRSNNQRRPRLPGGLESVPVTARRQDDIDGGPANETVQFGLGGADYEIDLSTNNAVAFRKQLAPFLEHARKAGRVQLHRPARSAASRQRSGRYPGLGERPWHRRQRAWAYPGQRGGAIPGRGRRAWENQRPAPGANQTQFQVLIASGGPGDLPAKLAKTLLQNIPICVTGADSNEIAEAAPGRRAFSRKLSATQCDAVCKLAGIWPVADGPGQPERQGARPGGVRASVQGRPGLLGAPVTRHNSRS